jgi:hypothetical protein
MVVASLVTNGEKQILSDTSRSVRSNWSTGQPSPGSHVPYQSLVEIRVAYMPDATWQYQHIHRAEPGGSQPPFWASSYEFRHFTDGSALASRPWLPGSASTVLLLQCTAVRLKRFSQLLVLRSCGTN